MNTWQAVNTRPRPQAEITAPERKRSRTKSELATETDLDVLVAGRLLRRIQDGIPTTSSQALMVELSRPGPTFGSARNLTPWAEGQNNLTAAQSHLVSRCDLEQGRLVRLTFTLAPRQTRSARIEARHQQRAQIEGSRWWQERMKPRGYYVYIK